MGMNDIDLSLLDDPADVRACPPREWAATQSLYRYVIVLRSRHAPGEDQDFVTVGSLSRGEVVDMHLDTAQSWEIAVGDMQDLHATACLREVTRC